MGFSEEIKENVLVASGRCCCVCHNFCGVRIELHHIKPVAEGGDDSIDNCIPLCLNCHAEVEHYNDKHPRGRKFTGRELRKHRDEWFAMAKGLNDPTVDESGPSQIRQIVSGKSNMVAGRDLNIRTERIIRKTVVQTDPGGKHISNSTAKKIQELVKEFVDIKIASGQTPNRAAQGIWTKLKRQFTVTIYKEIPFEDGDRAIQWLYAQIAMVRPQLRRAAPEKWKQSLYKPIYARADELNLSKPALYQMAFERLALKAPISSLTELTQRDLKNLHEIMIYEVKKLA